jgi:hypothetical protein
VSPVLRDRWALGAVLLLSAVCSLLHVASARKLSPIDEFQHIDYMVRASKGGFVRQGDLVGQVAMRAQACRGIEYPGPQPPCESDTFDPAVFQEFGVNTAAGDPPLYYFTTGILARAIAAVSPLDIIDAGRLIGSFWLGAALILLWALFAEFDIGISRRVVACSLLVLAPVTLNSSTTVTSDAVLLVSGAAILLTSVRWLRSAQATWVPIALSSLAALGKMTALVGSAVAALYIIMDTFLINGRGARLRRRSVQLSLGILAGGLAASLAWMGIIQSTARVKADEIDMNRRFRVESLPLERALSEVTTTLPPTKNPRIAEPLLRTGILAQTAAMDWLLLGAIFGSVFFASGHLPLLGGAALLVLAALGPVLSIATYVFNHLYIPTPPRYGLAALPALIVILGAALRRSSAFIAAAVLATLGAAYTIGLLATA